MPDSPPTRLYYVHDPMCSWCWGFRPTWLKLKESLPRSLQLISRVGGLAADSDVPMEHGMQLGLQDTWRRIQQEIPGTQFNFDFWSLNIPRRSTYPACRAVIAARQLADREEQMTLGIQQAYYLDARNPSDLDTLVDIGKDIGLDEGEFKNIMLSDDIQLSLSNELAEVRGIGINSFPGLLIQQQATQAMIALNYNSADAMLQSINHFLDTQHS